jgi:hypothetical protein
MGLGPYRPRKDLEHELDRGNLRMATVAAKDLTRHTGRPLSLDLALRLVALAAVDSDAFDLWACRWLARWLNETTEPNIDSAAELAAGLAELPLEPQALQKLLGMLR